MPAGYIYRQLGNQLCDIMSLQRWEWNIPVTLETGDCVYPSLYPTNPATNLQSFDDVTCVLLFSA